MTDPIDPPEIDLPRGDPPRDDPSRRAPSTAQPPADASAPDAPSPDSAPLGWLGRHLGGLPSSRPGAARADAVPRMETVRITAPDLARRAALRKTRRRLGLTAIGFALLFLTVAGKLTVATVIAPRLPRPDAVVVLPSQAKSSSLFGSQSAARTTEQLAGEPAGQSTGQPTGQPAAIGALDHRATIVDRNGQPLAISLPSVALFADPRQIIDPADATRRLKQALPRIDAVAVQRRLSDTNLQFAFVERQITPREELAVNRLGIPGVDFRPSEVRRYPMGRIVSQVLGGVDVDNHGAAGAEKSFDHRLLTDPNDLRLSVDVRVQAVVRDELSKAMAEFGAIGACGIVMDVNTGEVLAMVSLPDYDPNAFKTSTDDEQFNRAITGRYEPGSTFKLQTASMALDGGIVHIWDEFDASRPLVIGRFTITDFEGKHRWLYLPEVLAYSSNLGAAHIAMDVGAERQRAWLKAMGMFERPPIELPGAIAPQYQSAANWRETTVMTVGFGHGIAIEPLQVVRGTAAVANGGVLVRPTILALPPGSHPDPTQPEGVRVMQASTSETIRKLMRLVVTDGYGKPAEVPGYYVGGKTGTAEKVGAHGYRKHTNVAAFMSVFPMNAPRYAVYMMLDEPHGNKSTYGYATAGWVAAPAAGRVISRIAPMLGLLPDLQDAAAINQALYIPLQPGRPPGAPLAHGPAVAEVKAAEPPGAKASGLKAPGLKESGVKPAAAPAAPIPSRSGTTATRSARHDARHEAEAVPSPPARLLPVSVAMSPTMSPRASPGIPPGAVPVGAVR
ncbi:MAG TPA: penicillin-binding transpeptidase domain-containing protein [Acetobacteraceae bacterium]|jgi:cell division protein FtsI (penicillin-binding protein 3)|nr:penicillin-binding transpeptidase domain-containing protein [Acetobacteraceae bacterium]